MHSQRFKSRTIFKLTLAAALARKIKGKAGNVRRERAPDGSEDGHCAVTHQAVHEQCARGRRRGRLCTRGSNVGVGTAVKEMADESLATSRAQRAGRGQGTTSASGVCHDRDCRALKVVAAFLNTPLRVFLFLSSAAVPSVFTSLARS